MVKTDWVRTMRKKQGLKGFQLAERLQVSAARVSMLEKEEARGAVTLKMMDKVARAMGCGFEYRIVQLSETQLADNKTGLQHSTNPISSADKPRVRVIIK